MFRRRGKRIEFVVISGQQRSAQILGEYDRETVRQRNAPPYSFEHAGRLPELRRAIFTATHSRLQKVAHSLVRHGGPAGAVKVIVDLAEVDRVGDALVR